MQITIALIIMAVAFTSWVFLYFKNASTKREIEGSSIRSVDELCQYVIKELAEIIKDKTLKYTNDREYEIARERKLRIEEAYINCVDGKLADKNIIKDLISKIISNRFKHLDEINQLFNFDQPQILSGHYKMEIIFERLYNEHALNTMSYLMHKYQLAEMRYIIEDGTTPSYCVTQEDLDNIYSKEVIYDLDYTEALTVASTIVYEQIKGFGVVDTLRTMNIDGFNVGTSGSIMNSSRSTGVSLATNSIWLYFEGKHVHLKFLDMQREEEVRRIVTLLCRYHSPGPLTERRGYIVNTMEDHSRILALRPPASEYWACFVRKFVLSNKSLEGLIDPPLKDEMGQIVYDAEGNAVSKYHNAFIPLKLVELHMKAKITTAFTGRQGSGKTTMMAAAIAKVDAIYTIRILELAPELYLREMYPERNILSVAETPYVTAAELQDALKKSDAALSIVGEVASDVVAARMLQMGQVASIFTIFSHHAVRTEDLVHAITNSIVAATGGSSRPETVEPQVLDVIKADVHLDYDPEGNRYIERITEIIRLDNQPYPSQNPGESNEDYDLRLRKEYYERVTDRKHFETVDIIRFDHDTFTYYTNAMYSRTLTEYIMHNLEPKDRQYWRDWFIDTWSGKYSIECCKQYSRRTMI